MNPLSVYWSPWHRRGQDYEYFLALQPAVVKIMDGGPPDYAWLRANLPGSLCIARDWALSEQKGDMLAAPEATGDRHAREWEEKIGPLGFDPSNTLVLGINEPAVWDAGVPEALRLYTIAFLDGCRARGLRGGAMQLSVGWPGNSGPGQPPDWSPYHGVEQAIQRGGHALILHEYWAESGPGENWGWWGGRFMACPWDVPIITGECGVDMFVKYGGGYPGTRGWQGHMSAENYASECAAYVERCQADPRFFAATVFATDYQAGEWQSFDTEPAWRELANEGAELAPARWYVGGSTPTPEPEPPGNGAALVHPLPGAAITQHFYQNPAAYAQYGLPGHDGTDFAAAQGTPVRALADGIVAWVDEDPGYGLYVRVFHEWPGAHSFYAHLARQHVAPGQWILAGDVLGEVGSTGNSTGPHLHLEIRLATDDGSYADGVMAKGRVDPETWCIERGLNLG